MRYYYDTEFLEDGRTIELISIGIVGEGGQEYYAINSDMPIERLRYQDWLIRNVLPSLPLTGRIQLDKYLDHPRGSHPRPSLGTVDLDRSDIRVKPLWVIANEVRELLAGHNDIELWADYGAYDHVRLMQLWGAMVDKPAALPMFTHDIQQEAARLGVTDQLPRQETGEHDALADARHCRARWEFLAAYRRELSSEHRTQVAECAICRQGIGNDCLHFTAR